MDFDPDHSPRSLKQRLRSTICFSCCFRAGAGAGGVADVENERPDSLIRSSTVWIRSKAQELPEIGGKLVSRIGKHGHHRRHSGGDFHYDPLSYALNFDEGADVYDEDAADGGAPEFRYRNFSSRLPPTPPHPTPAPSRAPAVGIAC